ncbi:MAG: glycosyltransferase family 39 protein [Deltaproteobacteria bacterium]|nr:glycosyltransferase family 39 protein [Deltaproteobacteria bacterium]
MGFAFFMVGVNRVPVPTVDGAVRAAMARDIVQNHLLWPITYEGRVFTDHPPLYLWLTALSYKIFGLTDFAANLMPRLFAWLTVAITGIIALEAALGEGAALAAALILCLTRDFVLSSVRGYIEPVLEFFIYFGLYFTIRQRNSRLYWPAAAAGACVWLAAYSKGPVALWPFLFYLFLFIWNGQIPRRRIKIVLTYLAAFAGCTAVWAAWVTSRGDWQYWHSYLVKQVLSSALEGRDGAQSLEPTFFFKILAKYYWPWLPLLIWAVYRSVRSLFELDFSPRTSYAWMFLVTGLGFVGGFSLMKWKLWYYIAPAYPAFALLIALSLNPKQFAFLGRRRVAKGVGALALAWIAFGSVFPVRLHRERVPEVLAFKETIVNSPVPGPVWYVRDPMDHNMIGTSGQWYFNRVVEKVTDEQESAWASSKLKGPAWIITGAEFHASCKSDWCARSQLIQSAGKSALLFYK